MRRGLLAVLGLNLLVWPGLSLGAPPPLSDSVTVLASVCAPGAVTPVVTSPTNGATFTTATITVSGLATPNETLTVYRNAAVAGATVADGSGNFSAPVTLVPGSNVLTVAGCTQSAPVTVTYLPPAPPGPGPAPAPAPTFRPLPPVPAPDSDRGVDSGSAPIPDSPDLINVVINPEPAPREASRPGPTFFLQTGSGTVEGKTGQMVEFPFVLSGGDGPYRIRVQTGDGYFIETTATERSLLLKHPYLKAGRYLVVVEVIDRFGRQSILQAVVVVTNDGPVAASQDPHDGSGRALGLIFALEMLVLAALFAVWEYYLRNRHAHP